MSNLVLDIEFANMSKTSLNIPKGLSEAVKWRRTDNTMAKTKRTNNDLQNSTQQTEDRATRTPLTTECVPEV